MKLDAENVQSKLELQLLDAENAKSLVVHEDDGKTLKENFEKESIKLASDDMYLDRDTRHKLRFNTIPEKLSRKRILPQIWRILHQLGKMVQTCSL